jgi:YD repeat-containing protein
MSPRSETPGRRSIGLGHRGRAVVERQYWNDRLSAETFTVWRDDHALVPHGSHGEIPEFTWTARWVLEGGRAVAYERRWEDGWRPTRSYAYDASGRLVCMRQVDPGDDRFDYAYDAASGLAEITRTLGGKTTVVFRAISKGLRLGPLLATIESRLAAQIPAIVGRVATEGPAFCLALVYALEGRDVLPPRLAIGEAAARDALRSADALWNPAEGRLSAVDALAYAPDPALEAACAAANGLLAEGGDREFVRKSLAKLAAAIAPASLDPLPRTDDFVVLALHGSDRVGRRGDLAALARRLPAEVKRRWKTAGWL